MHHADAYMHKSYVESNYLLKNEACVVDALIDIGAPKTEQPINEAFEQLKIRFSKENKSLCVINNSDNRDSIIKVTSPRNYNKRTYVKISSSKNYKSFTESNKRNNWFSEILQCMNKDLNVTVDIIVHYLFNYLTDELVNSLRKLKLLNETKLMDEYSALAM